jgi:hypothetical protein
MSRPANSKLFSVIGWIISALPILGFGIMPIVFLFKQDEVVKEMTAKGYPASVSVPLLITEIICGLLFAIPQTAVLGAILLTGYLGGAIATHLRVGEPFYVQAILGTLPWFGLFFRDPRVRALIPFRK